MNLTGNTILITSGIGRRLAEALHDCGNHVIVTGRRKPLLDEITAARPGMAALALDLDDPASLPRLVEEVRLRFPKLNVVFANAGISRTEDLASDAWDFAAAEAVVETNILGVIRVIGALLPLLKCQPHPVVVATSSNLAFLPRSDFATYCASKAFIHSWLQSLRHQLRKVPVEVLELSPPYVQTELTGKHQTVDPRAMPLETYVAEVMAILKAGYPPHGEIIVERGRERRLAEREGRYDALYAAVNPA